MAVGGLAAIGIPFAAFLGSIGYFGGPTFFDIPARAAPSPQEADVAVIVFSGNMGFHIGQAAKVSNALAGRGIPVVGVNSLTYFRKPRSAAQATELVEAAIDRALRFGHRSQVALVGISFGADILHVGLADLPAPYRAKVRNVVLVVPGAVVQLQASPLEIIPIRAPDMDGVVTARRLDWVPTTCIWGAEEKDSLCPRISLPNIRREPLAGGHMLDRNIALVTAKLVQALDDAAPLGAVNEAATPPGSAASPPAPPAG
jgi:type IV secretory pathway VirJ component